jgi:hypothetical protein
MKTGISAAAEDKFDIAVIGAGPAGMMAAIESAKLGLSVVLIEKNSSVGKKLLLTGNGRCNLTNAEFNLRELVKNYYNGEFLFHAFSVFGPKEVISFFEKLGVKTKIEGNKRVFPASDKAEEILSALSKRLAANKVKILFNSEIKRAELKGRKISKIILNNGEIKAEKYIFCTGGKSYVQTGSDGSGYKFAEKFGHTIKKPKQALCPIIIKEKCVKNIQGISFKDVKISVLQNGKNKIREEGEILFTHFGLSGPAVLNISGEVGNLLEKGEIKLSIDFFPLLNQKQFLKKLEDILKKHANKTTKNIISIFVPERLAEVLLNISSIDKNKIANSMSKIERGKIIKIFKDFRVSVEDVLGFDQALVTRGGVSLKEIDHKTMKSKIIDNLFFAGEIIDTDGKTGGFNLQACWSTGYLAGKNIIN